MSQSKIEGVAVMPDLIRHPEFLEVLNLDSDFRRNDI